MRDKRRRDLNVYERAGELQPTRDRLAQAMRIARRYSRECDVLRAEIVRLTAERDQLDAAVTVSADSESALFARVWELEADLGALTKLGVTYELEGEPTTLEIAPAYAYPYRPATSESFDESAAATMLATEPLLAQDWDGAEDTAAWDDAQPPRGAK